MTGLPAVWAIPKQYYFFYRFHIGLFFGRYVTADDITWSRMIGALCLLPFWYFGGIEVRYFVITGWALCWVGDWLDGAIADATGTQSDFGKWFDPLADKIQFYIPAVLFVYHFTWVPFLVICVLDIFSTFRRGFGGVRAEAGVEGANWYGKWKTGFQIIFFFLSAFTFLNMEHMGMRELYAFNLGQVALWTAVGLSFSSLFFRIQKES